MSADDLGGVGGGDLNPLREAILEAADETAEQRRRGTAPGLGSLESFQEEALSPGAAVGVSHDRSTAADRRRGESFWVRLRTADAYTVLSACALGAMALACILLLLELVSYW